MIVDGKGKMFEDRRGKDTDRRKNSFDAEGGRRKGERRNAPPQVKQNKKK